MMRVRSGSASDHLKSETRCSRPNMSWTTPSSPPNRLRISRRLARAALGLYLAIRARREGRSLLLAMTIVALATISPMSWHALADGHPEEILGGALCVAAVLGAADGRRPIVTGFLLGLALATKQWAILVLGPVLL